MAAQQGAALVPVLCLGELSTLRNLIDLPAVQVRCGAASCAIYCVMTCRGHKSSTNIPCPSLHVRRSSAAEQSALNRFHVM